jgi:predicted DNA-binding transcriptional regulator AlpA
MSALIQTTFVILRKRQLCERIGLSPAQVYAMLDSKSPSYDPSFPRQIRLGASNRSSAVGWLAHEVQAWLEARIQSSRDERNIHDSTRSTSVKSGGVQ